MALAVVFAATAHAADYRAVLCAANNGSNAVNTYTNTTSPQNPGGIFSFENYCGPAPYPAGDAAFFRIAEHEAGGNAGQGAVGYAYYDSPPFVHFREAGAFTRQPNAFNDGWRTRLWAAFGSVGFWELLSQGQGGPQGTTSTFASHLWPVGGYLDFTRFGYELTCVRPAGCDRSNFNATDFNTFVFTLADESPSQVSLTYLTPVTQGGWVRGVQQAIYKFTELGSGIRVERVRIDGAERSIVDHASQCAFDSNGAIGVFARTFQPCPVVESPFANGYTFDTASLADGAHSLQVCTQDFAQWQGVNSSPSESCDQRTIYTDNTAPGAPAALAVTSANPNRYLNRFGATFSLPPNQGSPITKVHYDLLDAAGNALIPERIVTGNNPTAIEDIEAPKAPRADRLRVWLEDQVGHIGMPATAPIPHDTTPPAAPQDLSVTSPTTSRATEGFDVHWRNLKDAGSPITTARYQVLDSNGKVVVPARTIRTANPQAIEDLDTPRNRGIYTLEAWLEDEEGNVGAPTKAPLAYNCVRSDVGGGTALSAGIGPNGDQSLLVQQGQGSIVSGHLQDAGANASICIYSRVTTDNDQQFLGVAVTGASGTFQFPLAEGPSRDISVVYRPNQRELTATASLRTRVRPTFKLGRQVIRNGQFGVFTGSIPGPHNDNVIVVLRVADGKHWRVIRQYRTRSGGHFRMRYHFTQTTTPTIYKFRVEVPTQSSYSYEGGRSRAVNLRVLPK